MPRAAVPEELFRPLGPAYERASGLLSLGLEGGWRRRLVDHAAPRDGERYLDVATGTGLVARALRSRADVRVIGLDVTPEMLRHADRGDGIRFVLGRAERLPFPDATFDGLTSAYLLRYVDDPVATLRELARVVRPGGRVALLEFDRPRSPLLRLGWWIYTRTLLPVLGSAFSRDWRHVGRFLGPSIDGFLADHDLDELATAAGLSAVRTERLSLGAACVLAARAGDAPSDTGYRPQAGSFAASGEGRGAAARSAARPAFYALPSGGWHDYVTLLHPPYTLWHLSYVALGAGLASETRLDRLAGSLAAFFLALGVGVHALDERNGRPLRTRIPEGVLVALAVLGVGGAVVLGLAAAPAVGSGLLAFIAVGIALALAYPLELAGGRLHSDLWFALGWGAFPVLTGAYASGGSLTAAAIVGAAYAVALTYAQRRLSTWVRTLRRKTESVSGEMRMSTGERLPLDRGRLMAASESALLWLTAVAVLVAIAALVLRLAS